jgi:uncharacterized protein (DUF1697 family)
MMTYISFLRGVNMTGHNSIKMTDLAVLYKNLGFSDAETYIQSGNVIFSGANERSPSDISQKIEQAILEKFNYTVPVMVRSVKEIKELLSSNPFINEEKFDPSKMAVIFLNEEASDIQIQKVISVNYPPDKFEIIGKEIFIYCPNGFGRTKLYTNFFEKKMGVKGTGRNWKTITTIMSISENKEKQHI